MRRGGFVYAAQQIHLEVQPLRPVFLHEVRLPHGVLQPSMKVQPCRAGARRKPLPLEHRPVLCHGIVQALLGPRRRICGIHVQPPGEKIRSPACANDASGDHRHPVHGNIHVRALQDSAVKPIFLTRGPQRSASACCDAAISAAVEPLAIRPTTARLSITDFSLIAMLMAALAAATTLAGALAGAKKANHSPGVSSGKPCSAKVGTSGENGERAWPEVAINRSLPALWLGMKSPLGVTMEAICPPPTSVTPGREPRWGTCLRPTPLFSPSSAPMKGGVEPAAGEP